MDVERRERPVRLNSYVDDLCAGRRVIRCEQGNAGCKAPDADGDSPMIGSFQRRADRTEERIEVGLQARSNFQRQAGDT